LEVYKYRSGSERDIEALMNNQFFSASLDSLNDVQEAKVKINNTEIYFFDLLAKSKNPHIENSLNNILEKFINKARNFGIYSLSKNYDNELLWAYYSNSHQGFCIEYDLEIFKQYQLRNDYFCDVEYQKDVPTIALQDIFDPADLVKKFLSTKSVAWKHEEEHRIITGVTGLFHFYNRAIRSIYFGYRASEESIKNVMSILRGRGIKYYKMDHREDSYQLERTEIEDLYKDDSIYLNKTNKFIPELYEEIKPYEDLIKKAIIILEQEPMCANVTYVGLSTSKGTKENPVFFLSYDNKLDGITTQNFFISKEEIESIFEDADRLNQNELTI
jgi:hypothetical protein